MADSDKAMIELKAQLKEKDSIILTVRQQLNEKIDQYKELKEQTESDQIYYQSLELKYNEVVATNQNLKN